MGFHCLIVSIFCYNKLIFKLYFFADDLIKLKHLIISHSLLLTTSSDTFGDVLRLFLDAFHITKLFKDIIIFRSDFRYYKPSENCNCI